MRNLSASSSALKMALCALLFVGCGGTSESDTLLGTGGDNLGREESEAPATDGGEAPGGSGRALICHIPPGNHANAHTIEVGLPAVIAHLRHGDTVGACEGEEPPADGGVGSGDAGPGGQVDAGTGGDVDAGPACFPQGTSCDVEAENPCCNGLSCQEGACWPIIG
ncbi:hypothetical protein [Corallococcus llansteffanensis]|uniref:Lipoprotein n=1 Tax=Corallococcus llansteffanensis TaxID=2316731 RepID=A0A3A8P6G7_9BACT|nr:hypothetical protein [Corallococcus llansteffanensis]RKH50131.1 hypothetical protein D7V93_30970 [Corallococcus llansteffanensis]